jgi:hypothetical protein
MGPTQQAAVAAAAANEAKVGELLKKVLNGIDDEDILEYLTSMITENPSMGCEEMAETMGPFLESTGFIDDCEMAMPYCEEIVKGLMSGGVDTDANKDAFKKLATAVSIPSMENFVGSAKPQLRCPRCNSDDKNAGSGGGAIANGSGGGAIASSLVSALPASRVVVHFRLAGGEMRGEGGVRTYSVVAPASQCWADLLSKAASKLSIDADAISKIVKVRSAQESELQIEFSPAADDYAVEHGDWFEIELEHGKALKSTSESTVTVGEGGEGQQQGSNASNASNISGDASNLHAKKCGLCDGTGWISDTVTQGKSAVDASGNKFIQATVSTKGSKKSKIRGKREGDAIDIVELMLQQAVLRDGRAKGKPKAKSGRGEVKEEQKQGRSGEGGMEDGDENFVVAEGGPGGPGGKKGRKAERRRAKQEEEGEGEETKGGSFFYGKNKKLDVKERNNRRGKAEKPKTLSTKSKRHGVAPSNNSSHPPPK